MPRVFSTRKIDIATISSTLLVFTIYLLLHVYPSSIGYFAFTYDQGRDLLQAARIVYEGNLTLIGPTTGLAGIFYGPTWYYFLSAIFAVSSGNPQTIGTIFSLIGLATIVCLFIYLKVKTNSVFVSFAISASAAMAPNGMFGPTSIWSTSLTPIIMLAVFYVAEKIVQKPKPFYFFLLGIIVMLTLESEVPWGIVMIITTLLLPFTFKKIYFSKKIILTLLGFTVVILPRIMFNLRHDFIEAKALLTYVENPGMTQEVPILTRIVHRADQSWGILASSLTRDNKFVTLFFLLTIAALLVYVIVKSPGIRTTLFRDFITRYTTLIIIVSFVLFTIYKDNVWDYYLIGLPITFVVLISRIFTLCLRTKSLKAPIYILLVLIPVLNFNPRILDPFNLSWPGDGGTYKNAKTVVDYIASQNPKDYSVYAYSPARFDYPIDYLIYWYSRQGRLQTPKENSRVFYLVIREASSRKYHTLGWYGDKTKDNTQILGVKTFPGDFLVELHLQNENF